MEIRNTVASVETHERLVVELEVGEARILSLCRVSKESDTVCVEFDLAWQAGGVVVVPLNHLLDRLQLAKAELDGTYPPPKSSAR